MSWWEKFTIFCLVLALAVTLGDIIKALREIRAELRAIRHGLESDRNPPRF